MRKAVLLIMSLFLAVNSVQAYSGGSGTEADPYQISNAEDLIQLGETTDDYDKHFIMTADIDLAGYTFDKAVIAPVPSMGNLIDGYFCGVLNGNGHVIRNLNIFSTNTNLYNIGLIGGVGSGGMVKNLGLENVDITSSSLLCCGSLCGENSGEISGCYATGVISVGSYTRYTAGFCGSNYRGGNIVNCFAECSVMGPYDIGGFVGENFYGGSSISSCYFNGSVSRTPTMPESSGYMSWFCGIQHGAGSETISNCFWNADMTSIYGGYVNGSGIVTNVEGKTTAEMQDIATFTDAGWQFSSAEGDLGDWRIAPGSYPVLSWQRLVAVPDVRGMTAIQAQEALASSGLTSVISYCDSDAPTDYVVGQSHSINARSTATIKIYVSTGTSKYSGGSGISQDPYKLSNAADLVLLGDTTVDYDKYFILTNDIDLSSYSSSKAAIISPSDSTYGFSGTRFTGSLDGAGYVINNFALSPTSRACNGFIGSIGVGGLVKNLHLENITIYGGKNIGGICGENYFGRIINCSVSGVIGTYSSNYSGGICGDNYYGSISGCHSSGTVNGESVVGGLCGRISGDVKDSYSSASVIGNSYYYDDYTGIGGFCGFIWGEVENCHSSGSVINSGSSPNSMGGFCGRNFGSISQCFSTGDVTGTVRTGGFCGVNINEGTISDCYSTGSVSGTRLTGGFCGYNYISSITNCYAVGSVTGQFGYVGGLIGTQDGGSIVKCFWDTDTTGLTIGFGQSYGSSAVTDIYGKTTAEMQDITTYIATSTVAGWDFTSGDGDSAIWYMPSNTYPCLAWEVNPDLDGNGKIDLGDFAILANNWLNSNLGDTTPDFDGSGTIDLPDLELLASQWLEVLFVPEPEDGIASLVFDLVAHWKLDDLDGLIREDSSGNGYDGTSYGVGTDYFGIIKNAGHFGGNGYILVDNYTGITGSSARTVSAFIRANSDLNNSENNIHTIISWGDNSTTYGKWMLALDDGTGQLALALYGSRIKGGPDLEDGQWHHVAAVFPEGATNINQVKLYVDGHEIATNASSYDAPINTVPSQVSIGAANSSTTPDVFTPIAFFDGNIDDVRIYDVALEESQISYMSDIIGYWKLDNITNLTTAGSSVYADQGTVFGYPSLTNGVVGYAFDFDGIDEYVLAEDCYGIYSDGPRTVSAYIKAEADLDNIDKMFHTIVSWGHNGRNYRKWMMTLDGDTGQLAIALYGVIVKGGPDLEDGQWHHVAAVLPDGSSRINQIKLYVDGQEIATNASSFTAWVSTDQSPISIGAANSETGSSTFSPASFFNGALDEVRVYRRGLSQSEIAELANMVN